MSFGKRIYAFFVFFFCFGVSVNLKAGGVTKHRLPKIDTIGHVYRTEDSFKGIIEAFDKKETKGARLYLRTDKSKRAGYYFIVYLDGAVQRIREGSVFTLNYVSSESPHVQEQSWTFESDNKSPWPEFYAGITDKQELSEKTEVLAWRACLKDRNGQVIGSAQSFAWEMPCSANK